MNHAVTNVYVLPPPVLERDQLRTLARQRAEARQPLHPHGFEGDDAAVYERAYHAAERDLRAECEG